MQPLYTTLKVNNEIELCEVFDPECKAMIERTLLQKRISYFIYWTKPSFFHRSKRSCVFCINDSAKEEAETVIRSICDEAGYHVKFLMKKASNDFL